MKIFKKLILLSFIYILTSCGTLKKGFKNQNKDSSDEFLVEKKNPLTVPPDIDELPVPLDQEDKAQTDEQEKINIKKVLKIEENNDKNSDNDNENQNSIKKYILEKINE